MRMRKGNVVKEIPENLISTYLLMGWVEEKSPTIVERNSKTTKNVEEKEEKKDNEWQNTHTTL